MGSDIHITAQVARVLRAFLDDVTSPRFGMDLIKTTGLPSGTLYPILARLERAGWLLSKKESIDPALEGRPPRPYYTLCPSAVAQARYEVASLGEQLRLDAPGGRLRGPQLEYIAGKT